jgi:hypothetical protein
MIDTVSTSETCIKSYQTVQRNIPEDRHVHIRRREKLKSQKVLRSVKPITEVPKMLYLAPRFKMFHEHRYPLHPNKCK